MFEGLIMFVIAVRLYASVAFAVVVCTSVSRLSQASIVPKRLNFGSRRQLRTIAPGTLVFCCRRSWRNSNGITPSRYQIQVG